MVKLDEALFHVEPAPAMPKHIDTSPAHAITALRWLADYKSWAEGLRCRLEKAGAINAGQPARECL